MEPRLGTREPQPGGSCRRGGRGVVCRESVVPRELGCKMLSPYGTAELLRAPRWPKPVHSRFSPERWGTPKGWQPPGGQEH